MLSGGNIVRLAHLLGMHRGWVYRLLYAHRMWPVVNRVRRERAAIERREHEWFAKVERALRGESPR